VLGLSAYANYVYIPTPDSLCTMVHAVFSKIGRGYQYIPDQLADAIQVHFIMYIIIYNVQINNRLMWQTQGKWSHNSANILII